MSSAVSCGILLYRVGDGRGGGSSRLEVLLAHPGGPFWANRDAGVWTIPKGLAEGAEALEAVAEREFEEETGFSVSGVARHPGRRATSLGEVALKSGKVVHGWAIEGDLDPALARSNETAIEWPPRSGRRLVIPEIDRVGWFDAAEARRRIHPAQAPFVDRLEAALLEVPGSANIGEAGTRA